MDLVVRDFDDRDAYHNWTQGHSDLASRTPTVATARGYHVYATMDEIPATHASGVSSGELRAEGAYVLAPPSIHPDGIEYSWTVPLSVGIPKVTLADLDLCHLEKRSAEILQKRTEAMSSTSVFFCPPLSSSVRSVEDERFEQENIAITSTIPSEPGQRERKLFELARRMKAIHAGLEFPIAAQVVVFDRWWAMAKSRVGTKCYETSQLAFFKAVSKAKVPLEDVVIRCLELARSKPAPQWSTSLSSNCQLLAGICRELQVVNGDAPFFLSCRSAGRAINVSHDRASDYLNLFVYRGALAIVEKGKEGGKHATRYRYLLD